MLNFVTKVLTAKETCIFSVGQAGFIIKSSTGQLLGIDLYLSNCVERLEGNKGFKRLLPQILSPSDLSFNVLLATHPHLDHYDIDSIPEMVSHGAKLYCSVDCKNLNDRLLMDYYSESITYVKPLDHYVTGDFDITFVNCDHGKGAPDAVGVVIKVDGKTLYEVGDSCLRLDRINEIPSPLDVLISPINGEYGNMNSEDTAKLAESLNPRVTIPCHYGMFASHGGDLKQFNDIMKEKKLNFLIMQQGEAYKL